MRAFLRGQLEGQGKDKLVSLNQMAKNVEQKSSLNLNPISETTIYRLWFVSFSGLQTPVIRITHHSCRLELV